AAAGTDEPHGAACERALARAAFAHQSQRLALAHGEGDAVDGAQRASSLPWPALADGKMGAEILDLEQRLSSPLDQRAHPLAFEEYARLGRFSTFLRTPPGGQASARRSGRSARSRRCGGGRPAPLRSGAAAD